jgi:glutathione S-transferase
MLTLYYTPGACSMAAHIVLEESGEEYEAKKVDLAGGDDLPRSFGPRLA